MSRTAIAWGSEQNKKSSSVDIKLEAKSKAHLSQIKELLSQDPIVKTTDFDPSNKAKNPRMINRRNETSPMNPLSSRSSFKAVQKNQNQASFLKAFQKNSGKETDIVCYNRYIRFKMLCARIATN